MQCYETSAREYQELGGKMTDYVVVTDMNEFRLLCLKHSVLNIEIHISSEDMTLAQRRRLTTNNFMLNRNGKGLRLVCHSFNIVSRRGVVTIACSWFKKYEYRVIETMPIEQLCQWLNRLIHNMQSVCNDPKPLHAMFGVSDFIPIPRVQKSTVELHMQY